MQGGHAIALNDDASYLVLGDVSAKLIKISASSGAVLNGYQMSGGISHYSYLIIKNDTCLAINFDGWF